MLRFYNLITMKKTNYYCKKTCESQVNLKLYIFCKHIAILGLYCKDLLSRIPKHLHFPFYDFSAIYYEFSKF
jgi:hypothetical protein